MQTITSVFWKRLIDTDSTTEKIAAQNVEVMHLGEKETVAKIYRLDFIGMYHNQTTGERSTRSFRKEIAENVGVKFQQDVVSGIANTKLGVFKTKGEEALFDFQIDEELSVGFRHASGQVRSQYLDVTFNGWKCHFEQDGLLAKLFVPETSGEKLLRDS
jgi:hypothetical protein